MGEQPVDWAILVYISADRVLANFAVESLRQLKRSAGEGVIALVQAQGSADNEARRYVFDGTEKDKSLSIKENEKPISEELSPGGIADPENLTKFITWASSYGARHQCLFLWGHGYELLVNDDLARKDGGTGRNYLAPKSLKEALKAAKGNLSEGTLDIVGIDACSLSLVELACELADCADFLIASQEDVPDTSFPYEQLVLSLRERKGKRDDVGGIASEIPAVYTKAYQDYVVDANIGTREITLTSLHLKNVQEFKAPLASLANALLSAASQTGIRRAILAARQTAREFALGLFVDLYDFCDRLRGLSPDGELKSACNAVCLAIEARGDGALIAENRTGAGTTTRSHGLSIYFPYLTKPEMDQVHQAFAGGSTGLIDQLPLLIKGGTNILLKARSVKISEFEADFESLAGFKETNWSDFIKHGWSVILTSEEAGKLDAHYSAEQCAINLLSMIQGKGGSGEFVAAAAA